MGPKAYIAANDPAPFALPEVQGRSLFDQDWWLDAAAPGGWDRSRVEWDGVVVGEMAYAIQRRRLFTYIGMPHLTRTLSPRLCPPLDKPARQRVWNIAIIDQLMKQLPKHDRFERTLDVGCASVQGFIHSGLAVTHRITLRTPQGVRPEMMIAQAHRKTRQAITRAERDCEVDRNVDLDRFISLHRRVYGDRTSVDYRVLARIFEAARARACVEIVFVRVGNEDTAAVILVWDDELAYSWVLARDEQRNQTGAFNLLMYEATRSASRIGRVLDVDGYAHPSVGEFLTKFGFDVAIRPFVNGSGSFWRCYHLATTLFAHNRYDRSFRVG